MSIATPTVAERFAFFLQVVKQAVAARTGVDLSHALITLIITRLRENISRPIARIAARVAAGRYVPRHHIAPRRKPAEGRPRAPSKLPTKFGWLLPLLPDAVVFRCQLDRLLQDPEMAALLEAAPDALRRPVRSLCWMLRLDPPAILARPRPTPPPPATPPPATPPPATPPPARAAAPPKPPPPRQTRSRPAPAPQPPAVACGPPLPA